MTTAKAAYKTAAARRSHAIKIVHAMQDSGLPSSFILNIFVYAAQDVRSVYELMALWEEAAENEEDRSEVVVAMQELLDDLANKNSTKEKPYIHFDELNDVATKILEHKAKLRDIIDRNGGVSRVAELTGIPQPSLSRMLNSASMPRRSTLYKIALALNLSETEITTEFVR